MPKYDIKLIKKYDLGKVLGTGAFSEVLFAKNRETKEEFAIKCIDKKLLDGKLDSLDSEITILKQIKHPNIIQLFEIIDSKTHLYLIMELVSGGELFDQVVQLGSYTERRASEITLQILDAIEYIHSRGIVHRDLKPENILFQTSDDDSKIMVSDFGLSKAAEEVKMATACGTPGYVAPEILKQQPYDKSVDCWSIGVITYILLCGYPPFYSESDAQLFEIIKKGHFEFEDPYWKDISGAAKDFVKRLLTVEPGKRMTCGEALKHPWISGGEASGVDISKTVKAKLLEQRWKRLKNYARVVGRLRTLSVGAGTDRSRSPSPNPLTAAAVAREKARAKRLEAERKASSTPV
ncbi:calcium/calmodulin-dependent protein kinase type 1-like [Sycon ciliatum]|uniref:calcium/calmodulin-dependent protein kinase type 1-like n=1 Tax=Sycon ciliatum TaxID=27933 RepID=UPI0020AB2709|eukprot:scpid51116/ scgid6505/ Calcium/calmodulin-dependent protein kinase type 1; CaM kinase I; CaM kinase I alpha